MKNNRLNSLQIATTVIALSLSPLTRASVIYDESVSDDSYGGQLFTLSNGTSTFLGSQTWADAVDGFIFVIAPGTQATISMNYSYSNLPNGEQMAQEWGLLKLPDGTGPCVPNPSWAYSCSGGGTTNFTHLTTFTANSTPDFGLPASPEPTLESFALGSGTYSFSDNFKFKTSTQSDAGLLCYSINIEQTAVPLPSTIWFFGSGLLGVWGAKRKYHSEIFS